MNKIILSFFVLVFATGVLAEDWRYQVKQGDTLWDLAERIAIDATYAEKILEYNKIPDAHYLQPGTYIHIPLEWLVNLPSEVKIVSLQGSVHAILKGKKTSPRLGDVLTQGGELITGADSTALLEFSDGSTLIIRPNSHLKLNSIAQSHDGEILQTRIHIERGRINLNANPKSNPSHRMEIETPSAVSAVRGTQFRVNVDPLTKTSTTAVLEGKVAVDSQSVSREINQGFGVVTKTNEAPSPAIKLLDPPALPTTQLSTNRPAINLAWNSLSDATSYRVQVSS